MEKIVSYINTCRQKGFSDGYIQKVLKDAGHQDYIIKKALSLSRSSSNRKRTNNTVMSVILVLAILIGVLAIFSLTNFFVKEDPITGNVVSKVEYDNKIVEANEFIKAKNQLINQQIEMINGLDLTVDEKNALILEQTNKINELFDQIKDERQENLEGSIELINRMLSAD